MPRIDQILPEVLDVYDPDTETLVKSTPEDLKKTFYKGNKEKAPINLVYKVVYPDEFNLKVGTYNVEKSLCFLQNNKFLKVLLRFFLK